MHNPLDDAEQARFASHSKDINQKPCRQLVKTVTHINCSTDLVTFISRAGKHNNIEVYLGGDWTFDDIDRNLHLEGI